MRYWDPVSGNHCGVEAVFEAIIAELLDICLRYPDLDQCVLDVRRQISG